MGMGTNIFVKIGCLKNALILKYHLLQDVSFSKYYRLI